MAPRVGVVRARALNGVFAPPGDKSITHRAVLFGLLADGVTQVRGANTGEDCASSCSAATALGSTVVRTAGGWDVTGTGGRLRASPGPIQCGNSGTTLRLLAGIVAGQSLSTTFIGDASLSRRPMRRIAEPLIRMGASVHGQGDAVTPPLTIHGADLNGISYEVPMASAQVATCTLLAGLQARGSTQVTLPGPARDHTERMLPAFGVAVERTELPHGGREVRLVGGTRLRAANVHVPGDFSAAAFFLAAAAADPGARVTARGVNLNPTRTGFLDVLRAMGAVVEIEHEQESAGEPVGDVTVTGPEYLRSFTVPAEWLPRMVDEAPAWAVVAAAARGVSRLTGAAELRVKESDRIASIAAGLHAVGIVADATADALAVTGGVPHGGARIATHHDHRIAMAFAVLASRMSEPLWFDDLSSVPTSYPAFFATLAELGGELVPEAAAGESR